VTITNQIDSWISWNIDFYAFLLLFKRILLTYKFYIVETELLHCRALVTFGLNALRGRHQLKKGVWGGNWNSSNAHDLIKYTISKGYQIDSWEFGIVL